MDAQSSSFSYVPIISRPAEEAVQWGGRVGYVQDLWREQAIEKAWGFAPTPKNTRIFLCGNPAMIDDMSTLLSSEGYREHSRKEPGEVFVERYW